MIIEMTNIGNRRLIVTGAGKDVWFKVGFLNGVRAYRRFPVFVPHR